jgi:hypothetical protein
MAKIVMYTDLNTDCAINMGKVYTMERVGNEIIFYGAPTETEDEYPKPVIDIFMLKTDEDAKACFLEIVNTEGVYEVHHQLA